jgi:hypothetical protein
MYYLKCYAILFLIIPTLFLAGLSSSVSFGATDKTHIITPSKNICCKDVASASSDSTSTPTSFANPLKKISTKPTHNDEAIEAEKTDSTSTPTSFANPLKKISTKPTQNDEAIEAKQSSHETSKKSSDDRNLSDLIQNNLGKLINAKSDKTEDHDKDAKDTNDNDKDAKDTNDNDKDAKDTNDNDKDAKDTNDNDKDINNDRLDELRKIVSAVLS